MESGEAFLVSLLVAVVLCCAVPLKMNLKDDSLFPLIFAETSFFLLVADGGERFFFLHRCFFFFHVQWPSTFLLCAQNPSVFTSTFLLMECVFFFFVPFSVGIIHKIKSLDI